MNKSDFPINTTFRINNLLLGGKDNSIKVRASTGHATPTYTVETIEEAISLMAVGDRLVLDLSRIE